MLACTYEERLGTIAVEGILRYSYTGMGVHKFDVEVEKVDISFTNAPE